MVVGQEDQARLESRTALNTSAGAITPDARGRVAERSRLRWASWDTHCPPLDLTIDRNASCWIFSINRLGPPAYYANDRFAPKHEVAAIGIGGSLAAPPLPHHRTYGSVYGGSRG